MINVFHGLKKKKRERKKKKSSEHRADMGKWAGTNVCERHSLTKYE